MNDLRPGEFRITNQAMEIWKLPQGSRILDVGCGLGEAMEYLEKEYGYVCSGIDFSMPRVSEGKARNPNLDIRYGDGEFLDDFQSFSFDGVIMECTLSLINLPGEALHEAYCVLKKGGKLFLSDLYIKNPDPEFIKALRIEADRINSRPREEGECGTGCEEEHKNRPVHFRSSGRFLMAPLIEELTETGYRNIGWKDCSRELENYIAEKLMKDGTLEGCLCDEALHPKDNFKTGYFMLTAEKPF